MRARLAAVCLGALLVAGAIACSPDADDAQRPEATASISAIVSSATVMPPTTTGTATVVATPTASTTPAPRVGSVRELDFRSPALVRELLGLAGGGEIPPERVRYVDLTGDGAEEAVVVITSGGTQGDIGVAIYRVADGEARRAFFQKLAGRVEMRDATVVLSDGVYERGDAACCPSRIQETVVAWDGTAFSERSSRLLPNPAR